MQSDEGSQVESQDQQSSKVRYYAIFSFLVFVLMAAGAELSVLLTKANLAVQNSFFVLWMSAVIAVPVNGLLLMLRWHKIPRSERLIPHWKMFVMALIMDMYNLLMVFTVPHVSGVVQAVLSIDIIGLSISMACRRKRCSRGVYCSLIIILGGIGVGMWSQLVHPSPGDIPPSPIPRVVWVVLFGLAAPCLTVLYTYQDIVVSRLPYQSAIYVQFWMSVYIFLTVPLLIPITFIPGLGLSLSPPSFYHEQVRALFCFLDIPGGCSSLPIPCQCSVAFANVFTAAICALASSLAGTTLLLYVNASYLFVLNTLYTPLIAISFAVPFVMIPFSVQPLHFMIWISLAILVVGLCCYALADHHSRKKELEENSDDEVQPILNP